MNRWANDSPDYEAGAKAEFASAADSFLIGHAVAGGHTVVTHERISDGRRKIKIPNAAIANEVRCVTPFGMLRAEQELSSDVVDEVLDLTEGAAYPPRKEKSPAVGWERRERRC